MIRDILNSLVSIIYPAQCLICKEAALADNLNAFVCLNCWDKIAKNPPPFCRKCGRHLAEFSDSGLCNKCKKINYQFERAFSPYLYQGLTKELIHLFKYKGKIYLGKPLSGLLIEFIENYHLPINKINLIVPIPLHRRKFREREFNQAQVLARPLSEKFKLNLSTDNLYRCRDNQSQINLTDEKRWENVKGIFKLKNPDEFKDKNILLIDDVLTTGATVSEAAGVLKQAQAKAIFVLTVAN